MRKSDLPALLLLAVAVTHYAYAPLSTIYPDPKAAAKALFYILRGLEGALLFAVVAALHPTRLVVLVCGWGAVEELQTSACRAALPIGKVEPASLFAGLCGPSAYILGAVIVAVLACLVNESRTSVNL